MPVPQTPAALNWLLQPPGLPAAPPLELDPYLDAAARCFVKHGIRRTSVQDIAAELRVNRTTVYRQVGNVEQIVRLLLARDLHRLLLAVPPELAGAPDPEAIVDVLAAVVDFARSHPVLNKVLVDDPELIGPFLVAEHDEIVFRVTAVLIPLLRMGMDSGHLASRDPAVTAEWLVRLGISLILAPPQDVRAFLRELLVPALTPSKGNRR